MNFCQRCVQSFETWQKFDRKAGKPLTIEKKKIVFGPLIDFFPPKTQSQYLKVRAEINIPHRDGP